MGSRDVARGQNAIQHIIDKLGRDNANRVVLVQIDVTSDESVMNAVDKEAINANHGESAPLYGLVNNARGTYSEAFLPLIQKNKGISY